MKKLILSLAAVIALASCTKEYPDAPMASNQGQNKAMGSVVVVSPDSFQAMQGVDVIAWSTSDNPDVFNFDLRVNDGCNGQPGVFQAYTDGLFYRSLPTRVRIKFVYNEQFPQGCGDTLYFNSVGVDVSACRDLSSTTTMIVTGDIAPWIPYTYPRASAPEPTSISTN